VEVFDEHRRETFLVLDLHAVKDAAVGINADEKFAGRFEVAKDLCGIAHNFDGLVGGEFTDQSNGIGGCGARAG
jgi:hypothetical protein